MKKLLPLILVVFTGCESFSIPEWIAETKETRQEVEKSFQFSTLSQLEYQAFKNYFARITNLGVALTQEKKSASELNKSLEKTSLEGLCGDLFVSESDWQKLMQKCTVGRFFLCPEEVRAYPDIVKAIRGKLNASNERRFSESSSCPKNF